MDTNKDFIHIDDLFKQMHNGEEQERSGSWLQMKELLDKEMPLGTAISGGRSFRRFLIPLLASVLLVGGGVGYYELNKTKTDNPLATNGGNTVTPAPGADASGKLVSNGNSPASLPGAHNGVKGTASPSTGNDPGQGGQPDPASATGKLVTATGSNHNPSAATHDNVENKGQQAVSGSQRPTGTEGSSKHRTNNHRAIAAGDKMPLAATVPPAGIAEEQRLIEEIKPTHSNNKGSNNTLASVSTAKMPVPNSGNKNLKQLPLAFNNKRIVKDAEGNFYKEERDTFKRIDVIERIVSSNKSRNGKGGSTTTKLDTVAITRMEKVRYVPLDHMELVSLRQMGADVNPRKLIPMSNVRDRITAKEMVSLVPLTHYKVASRRVDPGKFNMMVQNTSRGISNYFDGSRSFYAAILVGGNTSFGNPGAFGMQLGIAGLYSLGERLTLAAELKYVNHYFSNYTVEDKSVTFENVSSQQLPGLEWLFSGTQNTLTSAYKVNSFGALEMPVTLNYNLGRASIFAGLNMAYAFPIKWNKENTFNSSDVQQTRNQNQNPFLNSSFKVDEQKDFASRFGLGYVWGLSYDISRKVSLDGRVTQILWDNNGGHTDAISRLFRVPTLQFSLGYYFGRKDKVVYIMDDKR